MNPLLRYLMVGLSFCLALGGNAQTFRLEEQQLHDAIQRADFDRVVAVLDRGADPNQPNPQGYAALNYAAACSDFNILPYLIQQGGEYQPDLHLESPLITAAQRGSYKQVMQLLQAGFDANVLSRDEMDLLTYAVQRDDPALYQLALQQGLSPLRKRAFGNLPLHLACQEKSHQVLPLLIDAMEGHVSPQSAFGWTPVHSAAASGDVISIRILAQSGADLNMLTPADLSPLHIAAAAGHESAVAALISLGATVHQPNSSHSFPIHEAVRSGNLPTMMQFFGKGADLNMVDGAGQSPLQIAAAMGDPIVCRALMEAGASPEMAQYPEVWVAVVKGDLEGVKRSVKNANTSNVIVAGKPLFHWALLGTNQDIIRHLLKKDANVYALDRNQYNPLHQAARSANYRILPELLKAGTPLEGEDHQGRTPLLIAVQFKRLECIRTLLASGADINALTHQGDCALLLAARSPGLPGLLPLVLKATPNLTSLNNKGQNALQLAAALGLLEHVQLLHAAAIPLDAQDNKGRTALFLAARGGHTDVVQYLLKLGVDPKLTNISGATPAQVAAQQWHLKTLKALPSDYE